MEIVLFYTVISLLVALAAVAGLYRWAPVDTTELVSLQEMAPDLFDPEP